MLQHTPARHKLAPRPSAWIAIQLSLVALAVGGLSGCSQGATEAAPYDPQNNRGEADASLPADARQRQAAVQSFLDALMPFNYHFEELAGALPEIRVTETKESFLAGKLSLYGWEFNGPPRGNEVPVVVFLEEDDQGRPAGKQERVYVVTGAPGRWVIARKP